MTDPRPGSEQSGSAARTEDPLVVELRGVTKSFGRVSALRDVDFAVQRREIVGLLGDNGAGKSTLIKIIAGVYQPDSGELYVRGERVTKWKPFVARAAGIETVHQDKALAPQQSIARNIFMGRELTNRLGFIDVQAEEAEAGRLMRWIGFTSKVFSPRTPVAKLSGGERQGVAIARALHLKAELVMLDEPTNALGVGEVEKVLEFVRKIKEQGSSAVFISHNVYHAYDVVDRLVLMDRGRVAGELRRDEVSVDEVAEHLRRIAVEQAVSA